MRRLFLPLLLLLPAARASAEEPAQPIPALPIPAQPIIVTGRPLPEPPGTVAYSVTELDRTAIVTAPSGRIEDVLGAVAGFQQFRRSDSRSANPSAQGITLRALGGNATSRALVLLDGVPVADPFFGYIPLSALAPERLGAIRVTRGGGSGPFGAGALAGTIELESADAAAQGPVSGAILVDDRGETEASATLAPELGSGFAVVSARWDRGRGFATTPADQRVPASVAAAYDSWSAEALVVTPLASEVELQARMAAFDDHRTLRFAGANSSSEGQEASVRLIGRGRWQFEALGYVQARNFTNVVVSATRFVPVLDQRATPSTGLGGKLELRPPVGTGRVLRIGLDYRHASGTMEEDALSAVTGAVTERRKAGGANTDLGFYADGDWTRGRLVLTGGVRLDRTVIAGGYYRAVNAGGLPVTTLAAPDRTEWTASWRAGAAWRPLAVLRLRGAAYTGLRQPTLNELYRPFTVFPVTTLANSALANERLEGFEAGVDIYPAAGLRLALTTFDNRVKGAIANVTIGQNLRQRQNLPAIHARGIEAGARLEQGAFALDASLAWTDAAVEGAGASAALDGLRPAQTPRLAASARLSWQPAAGWLLAATIRHTGAQFEDDLQTDILPSATTFDAFARLPLGGRFALVVRGENLFDETVVTRNSGGSIDLGTPRTLWAGVRLGY